MDRKRDFQANKTWEIWYQQTLTVGNTERCTLAELILDGIFEMKEAMKNKNKQTNKVVNVKVNLAI